MSCCQLEQDIRSTFGVALGAKHASTLETVGQLHDLVRAEFAGHLLSEPFVMSRFVALTAIRRALRTTSSTADLETMGFQTTLDSLLPLEHRGTDWRILKRELDGALPSLEPSAKGLTIQRLSYGLAFSTPSLIFFLCLFLSNLNPKLDSPVWPALLFLDSILLWLGTTWYFNVNGTHIPANCTAVADVAERWCRYVCMRDRHLPPGEREFWYLLKKIIADNSGCKRDHIGRETRFADLGIE